MYRILQKFDEKNFLGFKIWEFSLRSITRLYGWHFIMTVIVPHPLKTLKGLLNYRHYFSDKDFTECGEMVSNIRADDFIEKTVSSPEHTLIAMGYCQRPIMSADTRQQCPSERFSHDCRYYDEDMIHPACHVCDIKRIVDRVKKIGCGFTIMTSAKDIAADIFIPSLKNRQYTQALLFICPYSVRPIALPLFICGINFILVPFATGACGDFGEFLRADEGFKDERTFVTNSHFASVEQLIDKIISLKLS